MSVFFILIIGIIYLIIYSPFFQIKNINIEWIKEKKESKQLNNEFFIQDLKNNFIKQAKFIKFLGANNILIWKEKVPENIFKIYPQITELIIEKNYFKREIKLIIQERQKTGIWCFKTQIKIDETTNVSMQINANEFLTSCWWFDKKGIIFEQAPLIEGSLINKINDFSGRNIQVGESVLEKELFLNLLKIFEMLEKINLNIKSFRMERIELQEIITESSPEIYFSLRIDPLFALPVFESIKNIGLKKIEYIDLRMENRVYYKPK
ncbi:hypothetical protein JW698_00610 [Candidatus Wolfebacteria bacterium]|nr:hypothetical protein [Candidatus Wolfebacteria bacterium]